jgi:hypothetical protein
LPSLPAVLVEKQIIHVATAQFLSEWQAWAEREAFPEAAAHLATIVEHIRALPRDEPVYHAVDRVVDELVTDIRHRMILDLRHKVSRLRLQVYAEQLGKLATQGSVVEA